MKEFRRLADVLKKEKRKKKETWQPNQGHKIKRDNVAKLIFLKDPN